MGRLAAPKSKLPWCDFDEVLVAFSKLVRLLARYEPARVIGSDAVLRNTSPQLQDKARIEFIEIPTNDTWLRDIGSVFLKSKGEQHELVVVDFGFNAWGGKIRLGTLMPLSSVRLQGILGFACWRLKLLLRVVRLKQMVKERFW